MRPVLFFVLLALVFCSVESKRRFWRQTKANVSPALRRSRSIIQKALAETAPLKSQHAALKKLVHRNRNWWKAHRAGLYGSATTLDQRARAAASLVAWRMVAKKQFESDAKEIRRLVGLFRRNRNNAHARRVAKRHEMALRKRLVTLLTQFHACRDSACRYTNEHSMVVALRLLRFHKNLEACARKRGVSRRQCLRTVKRNFNVWTKPGGKKTTRRARRNARWTQFQKEMARFAKMETAFGNGVSTDVAMAKTEARLARHEEDLIRRSHVCSSPDCVHRTRRGLRQVRRERRAIRRMRRCATHSAKSARKECARGVLRDFNRIKPKNVRHSEEHLPEEEKLRRKHERARLRALHRRAQRCAEHDVECTERFHDLIARKVRHIVRRRRHWRKVHQSSAHARKEWVKLRRTIHSLRGKLHRCVDRPACAHRVLNRLIRRTKETLRHFHLALPKCIGLECRALVKRYITGLNNFSAELRRRVVREKDEEAAARDRRKARRAAREARRQARRRAHLARMKRLLNRRRRKVLQEERNMDPADKHHYLYPKASHPGLPHLRYSSRLRAHLARHRRCLHRCDESTSCAEKCHRKLGVFFARVNRHLQKRHAKCKTRQCRRVVRRAMKKLQAVLHGEIVRPVVSAPAKEVRRARRAVASRRRRRRAATPARDDNDNDSDDTDDDDDVASRSVPVSPAALQSFGFDPSLSAPDLAQRMFERLSSQLNDCGAGTSQAAFQCRARVMRRFRRVMQARETALVNMLRWRARARVAYAVRKCQAGETSKLSECAAHAERVYANQLTRFVERALMENKRAAQRLCEAAKDVSACVLQANQAFQSTLAVASAEAETQARTAVQSLLSDNKAPVPVDPFANVFTTATASASVTSAPVSAAQAPNGLIIGPVVSGDGLLV